MIDIASKDKLNISRKTLDDIIHYAINITMQRATEYLCDVEGLGIDDIDSMHMLDYINVNNIVNKVKEIFLLEGDCC